MAKRTNILLTSEDQAIIARLCERSGGTTTSVIRDAIRLKARQEGVMPQAQPVYTAQYWAHQSGDTYYVVTRDDGRITEFAGPLAPADVTAAKLAAGDYNTNPEDLEWAQEHEAEFRLQEPPDPGDAR